MAPRLHRLAFLAPFPTNVWIVQEDDGLTIVDTGYTWTVRHVLAAADVLGQPVRRVLLTHAHPDHAGGAAALTARTGAEVLAHAADVPFLLGSRSVADEPANWLCHHVLGALRALGLLDPPPLARVTSLATGDRVGRLEVLHSPGHTPGSATFWDVENGALFCGDNAATTFGFLHLGVPWFTLDMARLYRSLQDCLRLPARRLLPGHGPVYHGDVAAALRRRLG